MHAYEVRNIFESYLSVTHFARKAKHAKRMEFIVVVEEQDTDSPKRFVRTSGEFAISQTSDFTAEQTEWLENTFDEEYMRGLPCDLLDYAQGGCGDDPLPEDEEYGQMIHSQDVEELYLKDKFMTIRSV